MGPKPIPTLLLACSLLGFVAWLLWYTTPLRQTLPATVVLAGTGLGGGLLAVWMRCRSLPQGLGGVLVAAFVFWSLAFVVP
jgi:hypothetical protein